MKYPGKRLKGSKTMRSSFLPLWLPSCQLVTDWPRPLTEDSSLQRALSCSCRYSLGVLDTIQSPCCFKPRCSEHFLLLPALRCSFSPADFPSPVYTVLSLNSDYATFLPPYADNAEDHISSLWCKLWNLNAKGLSRLRRTCVCWRSQTGVPGEGRI